MSRLVASRILTGAIVLLLIASFLTLAPRFVPGDPATTILGPRANPQLVEQVTDDLYLDQSIPGQLASTFSDMVRGDFGDEWSSGLSAVQLVSERLASTLILGFASLTLAAGIGIPLGVFTASRSNSLADKTTGILAVSVMSVPAYVVALVLLLVFVNQMKLLPGIGEGSISDPINYLWHLILPTIALGIGWAGYLTRLVRSSMLEQLGSEYIRSGRAFGLSERTLLYRYALRNAMVPVVAILGSALGYLVAGTILVEEIFNRPGLGTLLVEGVNDREWAVVRLTALLFAIVFVVGNAVAEIAARYLDPRIQEEGS